MTKVRTNDGHVVEVSDGLMGECATLRMVAEMTDCSDEYACVTLPNIDLAILETVQRFFTSNSIPEFHEPSELFPLMLAADYLGYEALLDEGAKAIAESLSGRSPTEIRGIFDINP
jgi:hypothetical protein